MSREPRGRRKEHPDYPGGNKAAPRSRADLEKCTFSELKQMAEKMGLAPSRRKSELIKQIDAAFFEWELYKKEKVERYEKIRTLGNKGREARTYLVYDHQHKKEYAQKQYRKNKSSDAIRKEYDFQKRAAERGLSPKLIDSDTIAKTITMEKLDYDLIDLIQKQKGRLTRAQQEEILDMFDAMDSLGIFHADSNSLNLMYTPDDKLKIIDYGFAEEITPRLVKKWGTEKPNRLYLTMGLISQLKRLFPDSKFAYLEKRVNPELLKKYEQANPPPNVK